MSGLGSSPAASSPDGGSPEPHSPVEQAVDPVLEQKREMAAAAQALLTATDPAEVLPRFMDWLQQALTSLLPPDTAPPSPSSPFTAKPAGEERTRLDAVFSNAPVTLFFVKVGAFGERVPLLFCLFAIAVNAVDKKSGSGP